MWDFGPLRRKLVGRPGFSGDRTQSLEARVAEDVALAARLTRTRNNRRWPGIAMC
jgi:hypothetical protein